MSTTIYGTTRLLEEAAGNSIKADTIRTAERKSGFQTGVRRSHDGDILITVRLEPEVEFFATPCDFGGRPTGAVRPMTPSLYENTWGMLEEPVPLDLSVLERS